MSVQNKKTKLGTMINFLGKLLNGRNEKSFVRACRLFSVNFSVGIYTQDKLIKTFVRLYWLIINMELSYGKLQKNLVENNLKD